MKLIFCILIIKFLAMKEEFLHFLWRQKLMYSTQLFTTDNRSITIKKFGLWNTLEGPDFLNAQIEIDHLLWVGHVEFHLKSSDWYLHKHENDKNYIPVILHVVWNHDVEVFGLDDKPLPTLELKKFVDKSLVANYQAFFKNKQHWIPCEKQLHLVDDFILQNWLEKLFIERLEQRSIWIEETFLKVNRDWEALLFCLLAKSFGLNINGDAFLLFAQKIPFYILRKVRLHEDQLNALLFGVAGFLDDNIESQYQIELANEYSYLKRKFDLSSNSQFGFKFYGTRPSNFPTLRLAQLGALYHQHSSLFSKLINAKTKEELYDIFKIQLNEFWQHHYSFTSKTKRKNKGLTTSFIDLILINTVLPLKFFYFKKQGVLNSDQVFDFMKELSPEKNSIIDKFSKLNLNPKNAFDTQALLGLKKNYCAKKLCLRCAIGAEILKS